MNIETQNNSDRDLRWIERLRPELPKHLNVVVSVSPGTGGHALEFCAKYLNDHPNTSEFSDDDLYHLAAAFLTLAGSVPIFSYDFVRWLGDTCMFDGQNAIGEYAEKVLGMESLDTPVSEQASKRAA